MNKGWISLNRKIQSHWLWVEKREFSKLEAWLDILLTVNYTEKKVMIKNTLFTVKRGQSIKSLETWASRWKWSRGRVKRFFDLLKNDGMIEYKTNSKTTELTVCKYDSYQDTQTSNEHQTDIKQTSNEHQTNINNNVNNYNNENNEREQTALDFLKSKAQIQFNDFEMQNKSLINDWDGMLASFNDKIDIELAQNKIEFDTAQLIPRLKQYCRSWKSNQKEETPYVNFGNSKVIGKSNQIGGGLYGN